MSSFDEILTDEGFKIYILKNNSPEKLNFQRYIDSGMVQFHFGVKEQAKFIFNDGRYTLPLKEATSLLLYNPQKDLPLNIDLGVNAQVISILIPIKKLHALFSEQAEYIPFLSQENEAKKYYKEEATSPIITILLNQILSYNANQTIKKLYVTGKMYELLSLFFGRTEGSAIEQCPFLADEENVIKIRKAKDYLLNNMAEPPGLQELADYVGISLKKLKLGFKQIYGDSVYSFLLDYKLEHARKLLDSGSFNVNEAGLKIGYSTSSHFIAAFKKKFGVTPKKYLMSIEMKS